MKLGIMQPYFIPYIGYWQLMNAVDKYVIYDDVNFIKRGWINRNRILINGIPGYINVPMLGSSQNKHINEIGVNADEKIAEKNLHTIRNSYKKAAYFEEVYPLVEKIVKCRETNLALYIAESFKIINNYLGITTELLFSSDLKKNCELKGQDKILHICDVLGATEYYNAIGGQQLYDRKIFKERQITLKFLQTDNIIYKQFTNEFYANLSIVDVMMFNSREEVMEMLNRYTLL